MAPRLRKDLVATTVDEQGVSCVEVADPHTAVSFRFYDFEYALAQELRGQPLAEVVEWAGDAYGIELSTESLDAFIEKLAGLGFLVDTGSGAQPSVLVASSTSSGSEAFAGLPTTVNADAPPLSDVAMPDAFEESMGDLAFAPAAAPEGLSSGDATEYRLKGAGSGLWERPSLSAAFPALGDDDAAAGDGLEARLARLQTLAEPFPSGPPAAALPDPFAPASASGPLSGPAVPLPPRMPTTAPAPPTVPRPDHAPAALTSATVDSPAPGAAEAAEIARVSRFDFRAKPAAPQEPARVEPRSEPIVALEPVAKSEPVEKIEPAANTESAIKSSVTVAPALVAKVEPAAKPEVPVAMESVAKPEFAVAPEPAAKTGLATSPDVVAKPELGTPEAAKSEDAKPEPGTPDRVKPEPSAKLEVTAKAEPAKAEPNKLQPFPPAKDAPARMVEAARSATRPPVDVPPPTAEVPAPPSKLPPEPAWAAETPLASVAHFIVAESSANIPSGALDAGVVSSRAGSSSSQPKPLGPSRTDRVDGMNAKPDARSEAKPAPKAEVKRERPIAAPSWATELADDVDKVGGERRPPPARPEVIMMPPAAEAAAALDAPAPRRRSSVLFVLLLLGAAGGGAAWFLRPAGGPDVLGSSAVAVHIVSPQPTTFYRWFDTVGVVVAGRDDTLTIPTAGKLQDAMPPGTTFSAGETVARLQGVSARELVVNQLRSRIAFYEQLRDSRRAEGSEAAARQAEIKLTARKQELAAAQTAQAELEIHPKLAGEIAELLVPKGVFIKAGTPVFRIRATGPRATFSLPAADAARARALGFCRVETVPGSGGGADGGATETNSRAIDCSLSAAAAGEDEGKLAVDLVGATGVAPGTQVRLASARHDGVFPIPRGALGREAGSERVWIAVGSDGKVAESRVVEVAATVDELSLVSRGISVGDAVIVDPPASLQAGAEVSVSR